MSTAIFDNLTAAAVTNDFAAHAVGGVMQSARSLNETTFAFGVAVESTMVWMLVSLDPKLCRVHLVRSDSIRDWPKAHGFAGQTRNRLNGWTLTTASQPGFDRIIELGFSGELTSGEGRTWTLILEMTGPRSNAVLLTEQRTVIDAARKRPVRAPATRTIWPGLPYTPLPGIRPVLTREGVLHSVRAASGRTAAERINTACVGLGIGDTAASAAVWQCRSGCDDEQMVEVISHVAAAALGSSTSGWLQRVAADGTVRVFAFEPAPVDGAHIEQLQTVSAALELACSACVQSSAIPEAPLAGVLETALKRSERALAAAHHDVAAASTAEELQAAALLLAANLWQIRAGSASVTVMDYASGSEEARSIPLDPDLTPGENVKRAFDRARKMLRTRAAAGTRIQELTARIARLVSAIEHIAAGGSERNTEEMLKAGDIPRSAREAGGSEPAPNSSGGVPGKVRSLTSPGGYQVLVGISATGNDLLTTRLAKPSDLWLHVRAGVGAHVVIRANGHPEGVDPATIRFAAMQCALHSEQKHAGVVAVDVTERRYVRKPKGAAAGAVLVSRERTVHVSPADREAGQRLAQA